MAPPLPLVKVVPVRLMLARALRERFIRDAYALAHLLVSHRDETCGYTLDGISNSSILASIGGAAARANK